MYMYLHRIYLKSALKCDSFDVTIGIKILFFRVSVIIEPGRSLLQFVSTNCFILKRLNNFTFEFHIVTLLDRFYLTKYNIFCQHLAVDEAGPSGP